MITSTWSLLLMVGFGLAIEGVFGAVYKGKMLFQPTPDVEVVWQNPSVSDGAFDLIFATAGDGVTCGPTELQTAEDSIASISNHQHLHNGDSINPPSIPEVHFTSIPAKTYFAVNFPSNVCTAVFSTKSVVFSQTRVSIDPTQAVAIWFNQTTTNTQVIPVYTSTFAPSHSPTTSPSPPTAFPTRSPTPLPDWKLKMLFAPTLDTVRLVWLGATTIADALDLVFTVAGDGANCDENDLAAAEERAFAGNFTHQHLHNGGNIRPPSKLDIHFTSVPTQACWRVIWPNATCTAIFGTKTLNEYNMTFLNMNTNQPHPSILQYDVTNSPVTQSPTAPTNFPTRSPTVLPVYKFMMLFAPTLDPIELIWHGASIVADALDLVFAVGGNGVDCDEADLNTALANARRGDFTHQHLHNAGTIRPPSKLDIHLTSLPEKAFWRVAWPNATCTAVLGSKSLEEYNITFLNQRTQQPHPYVLVRGTTDGPAMTNSPVTGAAGNVYASVLPVLVAISSVMAAVVY